MKTLPLVDPEIRDIVGSFPPLNATTETLPVLREAVLQLYPASDSVFSEHFAPSLNDAPDVRVLLFRPTEASDTPQPAMLYMHGGGFIAGQPDMMAEQCARLAEQTNTVIAAVQYRLAPETPFPGPVEDCFAALKWLAHSADELGIDLDRLAVFGQSAGGGLAAATALMARDNNGPSLKAQFLVYPMLDARTATDAAPIDNESTGEFGWTRESNRFAWSAMQGNQTISASQRAYFSPAEAENFSDMPATWLAVGSLDLFFEENIEWTMNLSRAGNSVWCNVYPGAIHGFEMFPSKNTEQFWHSFDDAVERLL
ncbi:alpha/beta hydrolase [Pseudoalteromonas sp. CO302Y]|uniref:alpha/beta hydrolase n=1 Tax=unclassified Pseudoalteromonas TaxID=194690 RepID=UPI0010233B78|nr:alpha/beta hydrolase [Pseudoalteromonas sp. CO302Y]RZG05926.1 alpha/beta hydrolase [Pseudoalteromonas sp. CO133X]